jgi:hypothetical protein
MVGVTSQETVIPRSLAFVEANLPGWWQQSLGKRLESHAAHNPTPLLKVAPGVYKQSNTLPGDIGTVTIHLRSLGPGQTQVILGLDVTALPGKTELGPSVSGAVNHFVGRSFRRYLKDLRRYMIALPEPSTKAIA